MDSFNSFYRFSCYILGTICVDVCDVTVSKMNPTWRVHFLLTVLLGNIDQGMLHEEDEKLKDLRPT